MKPEKTMIDALPSQPRRFAFFDVDDTLINVKSMISFQKFWYSREGNREEEVQYNEEMKKLFAENASWGYINRRYYRYFSGRIVSTVESRAQEWYEATSNTDGFYHANVVSQLRCLRAEGIEPVFVSGSFQELLAPVAAALEVKHMLVIRMEQLAGRFTGRITGEQTIGAGKARAVRHFLHESRALASECYAFGDDITDAHMLHLVGHPTAVSGGRELVTYAQGKGWRVIDPTHV